MLETKIELFISEYFLHKAVIGKYIENDKILFSSLAKIFLIPDEEIDKIYYLAENEIAKTIATEKDFMRYQRMNKYSLLMGKKKNTKEEWEEIVRIKGNAIIFALENKIMADADISRNAEYNFLKSSATSGFVSALRIMGILQSEGIFLAKNYKAGIRNLQKSAVWNDCASILALLRYNLSDRKLNMTRLREATLDTPFEELYNDAVKAYGEADVASIDEAKLLNKAFNSGVLKREQYEPKYARVLSSKILTIKDKEKTVFSLNKEMLSVISDLPLKLSKQVTTAVDVDAVQKTALKRDEEILLISRALNNADLRSLPTYRPLCLCCNSKYLLNMYARAIGARTAKVHTEILNVAELSEYDLEPSYNNIFVRSIDEDKDNRFLLFFCGEISSKKVDAMKSILQSSRRAKFHLYNPNVTLNLGEVLPICFCDEQNAKQLKPYCDVVKLSSVSALELPFAVKDIFSIKEKAYGVGEIKLMDDAITVFKDYDIDKAERVIDMAVRAKRESGAVITLSRETLEGYTTDNNKQIIGFGGYNNARYK